MMLRSIISLPIELLVKISNHIYTRDVIVLRLSCKSLSRIHLNTSKLLHIILHIIDEQTYCIYCDKLIKSSSFCITSANIMRYKNNVDNLNILDNGSLLSGMCNNTNTQNNTLYPSITNITLFRKFNHSKIIEHVNLFIRNHIHTHNVFNILKYNISCIVWYGDVESNKIDITMAYIKDLYNTKYNTNLIYEVDPNDSGYGIRLTHVLECNYHHENLKLNSRHIYIMDFINDDLFYGSINDTNDIIRNNKDFESLIDKIDIINLHYKHD